MLAAATVIEIHHVVFGDFTPLDRWIDVLDRVLAKAMPNADPAVELKVLSIFVLALAYRAPWHEKLATHAARLLELAASDADPTQRIIAGGLLCWYLSWVGDQEGARQARAIVNPLLDQAEVLPVRKAWVLTGMAFAAHMCADAQDSGAIFARVFALTQEHGLTHIEFWVRIGECWHRLVRGEYKAVGVILAEHESALMPTRYLDAAQFRFVKAWLALLEGDLPLSRQEGETSVALAMRSGAIYGECFALLLMATVHIELQQHDEAADYIARFHVRFDRVRGPMFQFHVLLVEAFAALARRNDAQCAASPRTCRSRHGHGR